MFTVAATIRFSLDAPGDLIGADTALAEIPDLLPNTIALTVDGARSRRCNGRSTTSRRSTRR